MGLPKEVAGPLRHFYEHLWRIMTLNGVAGEGLRSAQAVLQGCAWSNPMATSYAVAWARWVESQAQVHAYSYADDWYVVCDRYALSDERVGSAAPRTSDGPVTHRIASELRHAAEATEAFLRDLRLRASPDKCWTFGTSA